MSEADAVARAREPATAASLARDMRAAGVEAGSLLLVHASLSALGWVCGGAQAVVAALLEVLETEGTLVMPAFTADRSEPSHWCNPPVPESWWPVIRATMPAFDPATTPTRGMGAIAECFRRWPGVRRSAHPLHSFSAVGPLAPAVTKDHRLADGLGETSPLARLYEHDARVLLLGVGHERNSSFHLAEYRARYPGKRRCEDGSAILEDGTRKWVAFPDLVLDAGDFSSIGAALDPPRCRIACAESTQFPQRAAVDFAADWIASHR
jgi:aminoglycoside 3-N-acetyltransferase